MPSSTTFDFDTDTAIGALNLFKTTSHVRFDTRQQNRYATGSGANQQVYDHIANELFHTELFQISGYFVDITPHDFWWHHTVSFCNFLTAYVNAGCKLSYHLAPALLEIIADKLMSIKEMKFFANKVDPEVATMLSRSDLDVACTGYDSVEDAYRQILFGDTSSKLRIYREIAAHLSYGKIDIIQLDSKLSGPYVLTPRMVLKIINVRPRSYSRMFAEFVHTLTDAELRAMLLTFGNTISLKQRYSISIESSSVDLHIAVCCNYISLSEDLFTSPERLQMLKLYFTQPDNQICDRTGPSLEDNHILIFLNNHHKAIMALSLVAFSIYVMLSCKYYS